ncbi:MAG: SUMF1/EgtB/PvdO family nonheme iron enzyme [Candidatus Nitrohelix vancouverensis]|uniref:SUMF1/EgtB/PvdO family nonheme iron enzyme n=1 Tax=Candidatus Nitrohelix vancouverensis TaxID=2705534 RepID=A0A7T0C559_9BACT|nr:MAG: SUMF1/EgtB/PvdO family nonheme iron enzyme [Candidatus Nitrohelix vancouverensis]
MSGVCNFVHAAPQDHPLEKDMVLVPAGPFKFGTNKTDDAAEALSMGVPKPWYADEKPEQTIFLKSFYIDRYEVTNQRFKRFVDDVYSEIPPQGWNGVDFPEGTAEHPVTGVNWYDASNFCQWAGKELPTEKQWAKAARGKSGREYPWGDTFNPDYANLPDRAGSKKKVQAVGSFPKGATPLGIHDLVGNVWEWTADDYAAYKGSDYTSPNIGAGYKTLRGASVADLGHFPGAMYAIALKQYARAGFRQIANPENAAPDVGFRCVSNSMPQQESKSEALKQLTQSKTTNSGNSEAPSSIASSTVSGDTSATQTQSLGNPFQAKPNLPSGIIALVVLSFVAGVFSFLSPCTLPILPAYFAVTAQADRARMGLMSIAFFCGLATLFVMMGASASFLGQYLRDYLFSITTGSGILIALFGVMTLFGKGFSGASFQGRPTSSFVGYFLFGAAFALGWTPCVGPILSGILLLAASDKTIMQGAALLFFYAMGLGLPLIMIATLCSRLPKGHLFWRILRGKGWEVTVAGKTLLLHSTNIATGILLIGLGYALAMGYMTYVNSLIPIEVQLWFSEFEDAVLHWFL